MKGGNCGAPRLGRVAPAQLRRRAGGAPHALLCPRTAEGINAFYGLLWGTWHRAALWQRHYVLAQLL